MDVHCTTCGEPWDVHHLWQDAIHDTGLTADDTVAFALGVMGDHKRREFEALLERTTPATQIARELIAGLLTDPQFGPVVMVGIGGIFAEALGDVAFRLAPFNFDEARSMLDDLAMQSILGALLTAGARGPFGRDEEFGKIETHEVSLPRSAARSSGVPAARRRRRAAGSAVTRGAPSP